MRERAIRVCEGLYAGLCLLFWLWLGGHVFFPLEPPPGHWSNIFAVTVVFGFTVFTVGGIAFSARMLLENDDTPLTLALFGLAALFSLLIQYSGRGMPSNLGDWTLFCLMLVSITSAMYLLEKIVRV